MMKPGTGILTTMKGRKCMLLIFPNNINHRLRGKNSFKIKMCTSNKIKMMQASNKKNLQLCNAMKANMAT